MLVRRGLLASRGPAAVSTSSRFVGLRSTTLASPSPARSLTSISGNLRIGSAAPILSRLPLPRTLGPLPFGRTLSGLYPRRSYAQKPTPAEVRGTYAALINSVPINVKFVHQGGCRGGSCSRGTRSVQISACQDPQLLHYFTHRPRQDYDEHSHHGESW